MVPHNILRPEVVIAAVLALLPMLAAAFFPAWPGRLGKLLPRKLRLILPACFCAPYLLVAHAFGTLRWNWLAVYALLPIAIALVEDLARDADPQEKGNWRDFLILAVLGLAVDLRWLEPAWPSGLTAIGKMVLLDAGIFAFLVVRRLDGVGFDLRLRRRDLIIGLREFCFYAPIAIVLGLALNFLHVHASWPAPLHALVAYVFTFLFIAIPEELFFRGWLQNLLQRRIGRTGALLLTAVLFGLAHWNKRTTTFNWQYVLLAALAGIFYGRAWRANQRAGASSITHATVDTVWSLWLR
ncbi:MAG TPA: CPBP family intramembrane glutamic endopeptidase [Terracidiphilus sp.]|nr:CPBP family intramembrane glutamic endopeptidase [Terracidiphilus sp.]